MTKLLEVYEFIKDTACLTCEFATCEYCEIDKIKNKIMELVRSDEE